MIMHGCASLEMSRQSALAMAAHRTDACLYRMLWMLQQVAGM